MSTTPSTHGSSSGSSTPCVPESSDPPAYTYFTNCDEEVIDSNLPLRTVAWLGSCYETRWKKLNVFLKDQKPNEGRTAMPYYDRNEHIHGTIQVPLEMDADAVEATLEGRMMLKNGNDRAIVVFLTEKLHLTETPSPPTSPGTKRFLFCPTLPPVYTEGENERPWNLPPTFEATLLGFPIAFVKVSYDIHITLQKKKHWPSRSCVSKDYRIPLCYSPSEDAPDIAAIGVHPIPVGIKSVPHNWCQITTEVKALLPAHECENFYIPSSTIYDLGTPTPFHIQLQGSRRSLSSLLGVEPDSGELATERIHVALNRRVSMCIDGSRWSTKEVVMGTGHLSCSTLSASGDAEKMTLEWNGKLRVEEKNPVGGFKTHRLTVEDEIVLKVEPAVDARTRTPSYENFTFVQPVQLVCDPWAAASASAAST